MKTAKELVNQFYQPLGRLSCQCKPALLWQYAKECAIEHVAGIIAELRQLYHPESTTFIIRITTWIDDDPNKGIDVDGETWDGYEKIYYWEDLKAEVEAL